MRLKMDVESDMPEYMPEYYPISFFFFLSRRPHPAL